MKHLKSTANFAIALSRLGSLLSQGRSPFTSFDPIKEGEANYQVSTDYI